VVSKVAKPLCVGACSGLLAGVFGVGGGAITVPALSFFTDLDYQVDHIPFTLMKKNQ